MKDDITVKELFKAIAGIGYSQRIEAIEAIGEILGNMEVQFCSQCGGAFVKGYWDGRQGYCSDPCLLEEFGTMENWYQHYRKNLNLEGEAYWSDWTSFEGEDQVVEAYNGILLPALAKAREEERKEKSQPSLLTFWDYRMLVDFCERHIDPDRRIWYWGEMDTFNGELHTLNELKADAKEDWFEDGGPVKLWIFRDR